MYLGNMIGSLFSMTFIIFAIAAAGYLLSGIRIGGVSVGTAGVLIAALLYGILASYVPSFYVGGREIVLFSPTLKSNFSLVSGIGTAMFVTSVGLIAGPKFFRNFKKSCISYVIMGAVIILVGAAVTAVLILLDGNLSAEMAVGLMTGALTSTPGLSAAKEVAGEAADQVVAGYGIAYLFGVLGVVFFVQLMPRILRADIEKERESFVAANAVEVKPPARELRKIEPRGFLPFFLSIALGCIIGSVYIPGAGFSLGASGGCLIAGLVVGHFGHLGGIDLRVGKGTLDFFRELGLILFLIGAGVPGGVNFISNVKISYFIYGAVITLLPMIAGFLVSKYIFRLDLFNSLGSITGGMTSTPALGSLISVAGTDEVSAAYAATYPIALVFVVVFAKILLLVF